MSSKTKKRFYPFWGKRSLLGALVAIFLVFGGGVETRTSPLTDKEVEEQLKRLNKPAVKTIMSEDGDIVDCVDIYKQPAFDHPLLRNHTIEMGPNFIPKITEATSAIGFSAQQIWQKNGSCPNGTIPIQRARKQDIIRTYDENIIGLNGEFSDCQVEVARVELHHGGPYIGAQGTINTWNLSVEDREWSLNSVTVFNDVDSFVEAGWAVSPVLFGDKRSRLFINWRDTSKDYGCFNLRCTGFVQVSSQVMLGGSLNPSRYDEGQFDYTFEINKDAYAGKWWMLLQKEPVGYWPFDLFDGFEWARRMNWGGSVCNLHARGSHTGSQMGSGHFPVEGYKRASYIRNILAIGSSNNYIAPYKMEFSASYHDCYDVTSCSSFPDDFGPCIFYGGAGGSCCDKSCSNQV